MCLIYRGNDYSFLDHRQYTYNLYKNILVSENDITSFGLLSKLFFILFEHKGNRKRCHNDDDFSVEAVSLKKRYEIFLSELDHDVKKILKNNDDIVSTETVRQLSRELHESTAFDHLGIAGGNLSDYPLKCKVMEDYFLIPPKSRFLCGCVKEQCLKLDGNKYDIVLADPPWWNKYIRRLKGANKKLSYSMMYNEDIASIPVKNLMSSNCLVAVWCTNSSSNIEAVKNVIFPQWGIEYLTTWYWLKVTVDMQPICAFSAGSKKQPYERIILGKVGDVKDIPDSHLIISIPSALHSHKPPLLDLLTQFVNTENPQVLELFARYLLPNTTSIGYEPLKWQHISLYESITTT